jgi:hypothetical protein
VLSVVDRNGRPVRTFGAAEVEAMLAAFARPGATAASRTRGADIVRRVQQRNCWFRCGCLDGTEPAPILVPVLEQHIRRSPHHPDHADGCPFEMGDAGNAAHARRLREPEPGDVFRLVRAIRPGDAAAAAAGARTGQRGACKTYDRDKLSQLLFKLLSDAGVHRVGRGPRGPSEQWEAVYRAARGVPLGEGLRLSDVLHTDPGQLDLLLGCLRSRQRWPKMTRPHGVLVFVAARIEGEVVVAASGARLAVEGPIAVFGPGRGSRRTGPFIVAVLVASPDGCAPPVPMKAYAQPCWSADDILPLDSGRERETLDILVRFQGWMAEQGYAVGVTKPLFDRAKYYFGNEEPDQGVKPDFEGTVHATAGHRFLRSFVVETMGIDTDEYRTKKARLKQILTRKPGFYLEHVAHGGAAQAGCDARFRKDLFAFGKLVMQADKRKTA